MKFTDETPGLARIANELKDSNEHLKSANQKLILVIKNLKLTAMNALEPIDLMVMNEKEVKLYELIKTL